jgi:hypothetical protein
MVLEHNAERIRKRKIEPYRTACACFEQTAHLISDSRIRWLRAKGTPNWNWAILVRFGRAGAAIGDMQVAAIFLLFHAWFKT